jgi:hypothetical protein
MCTLLTLLHKATDKSGFKESNTEQSLCNHIMYYVIAFVVDIAILILCSIWPVETL